MAGKKEEVDARVVENADGSAYVPGVFTEGHQSGESDEDDDDLAGAAGGHESVANADGTTEEQDELAQAETDADREVIRARRRKERADKKARAAEKVETLERQLRESQAAIAEMSQRIGATERRSSSADLAQIDEAIRTTSGNIEKLRKAIATGTKNGDGDLVANATIKVQEEMQRAAALTNAKAAYVQNEQARTAQGTRPPAPDVRIQNAARAWAAKNPWYDPAGRTEASAIVRAIDNALSEEGRSPADPSYWDELDKRIARRLPEVSGGNVRPHAQGKPSGGARVAGSGSESTGNGGSSAKGYTLSPARVQALKEAGRWDDPKVRAKAIQSYRDYDRTHGSTR